MSLPVQQERGGGGEGEAEAGISLRSCGRAWDPGLGAGPDHGRAGVLAPGRTVLQHAATRGRHYGLSVLQPLLTCTCRGSGESSLSGSEL